ncbi:MAG: hypothetical protein GY784_13240 [Gammaproteobacteria bacterium]|nr:hypothetical protein [Gammaproteobacteria bacterium]
MNSPEVPISWGELVDKITILQIKLDQLSAPEALSNVQKEYGQLQKILVKQVSENMELVALQEKLHSVNQALWKVEDELREKEREKCFDEEFIQLARSVYYTNDERALIKREINTLLGSALVEEKSYADY